MVLAMCRRLVGWLARRRLAVGLVVLGLLGGLVVFPRVDVGSAGEGGLSAAGGLTVGGDVSGGVGSAGVSGVRVPGGGGRGVDDVGVVSRSAGLLAGDAPVVLGSGEGLECLLGDGPVGGCVVSQLQPVLTAAAACADVPGNFLVREGSVNGSGLVSFSYPGVLDAVTKVPSAVVDGVQGRSYSWAYSPSSATPECPLPAAGSWRSFRVDVVRAGVEESLGFGPFGVGLSSGSLTFRVGSTRVGLVGGTLGVGLAYRSPGAVRYVSEDPTQVLPDGWALDGLGELAPWVSARQVGSGQVPAAVVLSAFDGQQVEFTNTLAGTGATGGAWAPPVGAGWASGQFGSLVDSGDLTAAGSTLTWSSGQQVVTFEKTSGPGEPGVWGVVESRQVEPGGLSGAAVRAVWDTKVSPARLESLEDPASNKSAGFVYSTDSSGGSCDGVAAPVDGSDRYYAPEGLLCGWSNFDGRMTYVWYSPPVVDPNGVDVTEAYQVGWVQGPGGLNTQLSWVTDGQGSSPQLRGVQLPLGHDAQAKAGLAESATKWRVNYDGLGRVGSVVSPVPGVDVLGVNKDRVARVIEYKTDAQGDTWSTVSHGVLADQTDPTSVTQGALLIAEVRYDAAWRPVRYAVASSRTGGGFFFMNKTWDTVNDRLLAVAGPNGRQTVSEHDYLGRVINRWGPAPATDFEIDPDGRVVPKSGIDDTNVVSSTSSFDADAEGKLAGLTVSTYTGSSPGGVPAATLGSCVPLDQSVSPPVPVCEPADSLPLSWKALPAAAKVSGGDWSLNAVGSREAPVDSTSDGTTPQLLYRVTAPNAASLTLYASGICATTYTAASCDSVPSTPASTLVSTVAVPPSISTGDPVTLQLQYTRDATAVSGSDPLTFTIEESTDGGTSWTALTARDVDPGFGLTSSHTQADTFSQTGGVETITTTAAFTDPQRQQVGTATVTAGGVTASMTHTYETYDGTATWGRTLASTDLAGTTVAASYWGPTATTTDPCTQATSPSQAGLQATFTMAETSTGDAKGMSINRVYDVVGRPVAQTHTSEDGQATYTTCGRFDDRDQPLSTATTDAALASVFAYPWNDPKGTDPFTTTATHTAPDTNGASRTYTSSSTVDLLGRTVSLTDPWGTTTITDYAIDAANGVGTITATTTTAAGFTVTETTTVNADGTTNRVVRDDGTTTLTAAYTYNADSTVHTVAITNGSVEIVTETRNYHPTTGVHVGSTWTQGSATIVDNQLTDAPNALRVLGETITTGGVTYTWDYTYGSLARLTQAKLTSTDDSTSGTWVYAFEPDTNTMSGENPDAYLNGNISSKTVTPHQGAPVTVEYHYDYADRLTRTTDPDLTGFSTNSYDSFGNITQIGANTITYNTVNAPIRVTDGNTTIAYTRLIGYPIIEKTTTATGTDPVTIRYSHNGLILDPAGNTVTQIHQFGPVTITTPTTNPTTDTTYQINTLRGDRLLTLDHTGTPTTTPTLFDPYGNPITTPNPNTADTPDYAWQGAANAETETLELPYVMMGARVYLPQLGRFTSPDPKPGASASEYTYARSDPINHNDPDGLSPKGWRSFTGWWKTSFVDFWKHDIPKAWDFFFHNQNSGVVHVIAFALGVLLVVVASVVIGFALYSVGGLAVFAIYGGALSEAVAAGDVGTLVTTLLSGYFDLLGDAASMVWNVVRYFARTVLWESSGLSDFLPAVRDLLFPLVDDPILDAMNAALQNGDDILDFLSGRSTISDSSASITPPDSSGW